MKNLRFFTYLIACFVGVSFSSIKAQLHWESMIIESVNWKYLAATSEPDADWYKPNFNDAIWPSGPGGIGYGDNDDNTIVPRCNSLYIRTKVAVADVNVVKDLLLDIDYDDAFVLYINGVECARSSNVVGDFPPYTGATTTDREAKMYSGGSPERYQLSPSMLTNGINVFALHILNHGPNSSDLSSRVFVHALLDAPTQLYYLVPSWFTPPIVITSNLPLILINTKGKNITQDIMLMSNMKVINNPTGINKSNDTTFEYDGFVGIKIRGFTSAGFPKKSYTVETRKPDSTNRNVNLLGLPKENDWVFHGPYPDKSLMRNALMYHLGNTAGRWTPRTRFFELILNGEYQGAYTLVEKIKIDKNRLNLADVLPRDTIGDEITGGYVLKLDRPETTDVEGIDYWISPFRANTRLRQKQYFLFQDPEGGKLHKKQFDYIKKYITDFERAVYSVDYRNLEAGYYPYIDIESFVDYYILTELARDLDGYRISTFLYKDKDSKGGKLKMGPLWDYDIALGNANFFSAGDPVGWVIDGMGDGDGYAMPFWWQKFRLDPYFNHLLKQRWNFLKTVSINTDYINQFIDKSANEMREAQVRNFQKWDILNIYVWPNNYISGTYSNELSIMKKWIKDRINWMDSQIQAIPDFTSERDIMNDAISLSASPNPFDEVVNFKFHLSVRGKVEIIIHDVLGRKVIHHSEMVDPGIQITPITISNTESNVFIYQVLLDGMPADTGKLVRKN